MQLRTKRMNIAIDLTPILPHGVNGGAKLFILELIQQLSKQSPDIRFLLLTNSLTHEELQHLDAPHVQRHLVLSLTTESSNAPPRNSWKNKIARRIDPFMLRQIKRFFLPNRFLSSLNVDLLFCPLTTPSYYEKGIPMVCTLYDLQYKTHPEFFTATERLNRERSFHNACRFATKLVTISDYTKNSVLTYYKEKEAQVSTIYIRMAQRLHQASNANILEQYALKPKRYLIYPANYWKHKNHEMLLTAFAIAVNKKLDDDIKLVCTGALVDRQHFLKQAADLMHLNDRVLFLGYLSNEDLDTLISQARAMIYPSLYEGFGLPILEAMANGVSVACSNTTALPEIAGEAAILFNPRIPEDIAHAILNLTQLSQCVKAGLERAQFFADPSHMAQAYLNIFEEAIHES